MIPNWKSKTKEDKVKTSYVPWDIGSDFNLEYTVQGEHFKTNVF